MASAIRSICGVEPLPWFIMPPDGCVAATPCEVDGRAKAVSAPKAMMIASVTDAENFPGRMVDLRLQLKRERAPFLRIARTAPADFISHQRPGWPTHSSWKRPF